MRKMRKMRKIRILALLTAVLLLNPGGIIAEEQRGTEARDLTSGCTFQTNGKTKDYTLFQDGELKTYFPFREKRGVLTITAPEPAGGISVMLFDRFGRPLSYDLQVPDGEGEWRTVASGGEFLAHWHKLETPVRELRIAATCRERMRIAELRVFSPGEKPAEIQDWQRLTKCDLMLLTAHPDDEILWFGGLLPVYAGERGYRVQVSVLVPTGGQRKLELLSALWHCGVRGYPDFLGFLDKNGHEPQKQYSLWRGKNRVIGRVVETIRRFRPEVVITHGEQGEYGHGAHKTAADAAKIALKLAADEKSYPDSAKTYGAWQIRKMYLHEYPENPVICDWSQPLETFGGKTGYEVAEEAFAFHGSQVRRNWFFEIHGEHDNAHFGLYYTEVGPDSGAGDLMEHIPEG